MILETIPLLPFSKFMWTKGWTGAWEALPLFFFILSLYKFGVFPNIKKWNVNLFSFPYPPSFNTVIFQRHWKMTRLLILGLRLLDVTDLIPSELWKTRNVKTCKWGEAMKNPHSFNSCSHPSTPAPPLIPLPQPLAPSPNLWLNILRSFENPICVLLNASEVLEAHSL